MRTRLQVVIQIFVVTGWVMMLIGGYLWFKTLNLPLQDVPRMLQQLIRSYGALGPLVVLGVYLIRSIIVFIPVTVLTLIVGSLYGPVFGTLLNLIGENVTATIAFAGGRIFRRRFVHGRERGWVKTYDELFQKEGFLTMVFMRAVYVPFDLVNYGSGMTGIAYRHYASGTFVGLLPSIVTFTVLGNAFAHPKFFILFGVLLAMTIVSALCIRRSPWIKRRINPAHVFEAF